MEINDPLKGKFFLSYDQDGRLCWQGKVLDRIDQHGFYLVETYDWMGSRYCQHVVHISDMKIWKFFVDIEGLNHVAKYAQRKEEIKCSKTN